MEKRLIVAIVLSFLVLMGYQYFFVKPNKPAVTPVVPSAAGPSTPVPGTSGEALERQKAAAAAVEAKPAPVEAAPAPDLSAVAGRAEADVVVETSLYPDGWSNKGGWLKSV